MKMFEKIYEVTCHDSFEVVSTDLFTDLDLAVQCFVDWHVEAIICEYPLKEGKLLPTPLIERHPEGNYDYWGETGEYVYEKIMERKEDETKS